MIPIFRRELKAAAGRREVLAHRMSLGFVMGTFLLVIALATLGSRAFRADRYAARELRSFGGIAFCSLIGVQLFLLSMFVPALVARTIAEERERDTLPFLLLTRLTRIEIVSTKLAARLVPALSLLLVGCPLQLATAEAAGLFPGTIALIAVAEVTTVVLIGALAILASARCDKAASAEGVALLASWGWLLVPSFVARMPIRVGSLGGEIVGLFKAACALIAPSSPLSLATNPSWMSRPVTDELATRLVTMIAMQTGFAALAVLAATSYLKAREPHPSWMDPYRGYRPPCGDDPIFWREFELPTRRGSPPKLLILARHLVTLFLTLLMVLLQIFGVSIVLAMPIGLAAGTVFFGIPSFREAWGLGGGVAGSPFAARDEFNHFVRLTTGFVTMLALVAVSGTASAKITIEHDKKTWLSLLATPLEGPEILGAKMRATVRSLSVLAWLTLPIWLAGVAGGAVLPLGAALAALDFGLASWAGVALGTWIGIRRGTTSAASTSATFGSLALMAVHLPLVAAALSSSHDLRTFALWDDRLRWAITVALIAVPALTALLAWRLTRLVFRRFDEWADRPIRPSAPPPAPDVSASLPAPLRGHPAAES